MIRRTKLQITKLNRKLAVWGTKTFSTMWAFYAFFGWGLLVFVPALSAFHDLILLISSAWIQLWALPLISVGNSVMGEKIEERAQRDHEMLIGELNILKQDHVILLKILDIVTSIQAEKTNR